MLKEYLEKLICHKQLTDEDFRSAFKLILTARADPLQIAAFLVLLRAKTETAAELNTLVTLLRQKMRAVRTPYTVFDIVGTGGDGANTVNISTGSAILAASCGIKIAKHGNRAVSSQTGSADVLEALGLNIDLTPEQVAASIEQVGIGFCFSPNFHPAMQKLRAIRQQLKVPTIFNLIGPLLNPTSTNHILLGVMNENLLPLIASVLQQLGCERAIVAWGANLDEISCLGTTKLIEVTPTSQTTKMLDPRNYGFDLCKLADLRGGDAATNAQLLLQTFNGKAGAIADSLILNAATALYLANIYSSIAEAIPFVKEKLFSGAALRLLNHWIEFSHDQ